MRYLLPFLFLAAPALAQQPAQYSSTAEMLLRQALTCESLATSQYQQLTAQITVLTKQVTDLAKERDDLKAAAAKPTE